MFNHSFYLFFLASALIRISTSRRQSSDSSMNDTTEHTPPPKKKENLITFEDDDIIPNNSPTKSPALVNNSTNSPKLNPNNFQSPPSPSDGFFNEKERIVSPLIDDRDLPRKISSTPILQARDFFEQEVEIDDEIIKNDGNVHTVHNEISTTTIISGDEDTLTDEGADTMTDEGEAIPPPPVFPNQFESPRQDKITQSHSTTELDKLLFGEESMPSTPLGVIDVENAMEMLNRSPATSLSNINPNDIENHSDGVSSKSSSKNSSSSFEMLDQLIGNKTNGETQSGTTTRILSMFDDKPYADIKRSSDSRDHSPSSSSSKSSEKASFVDK
jgi:hypothetical protein